MALFPSKVYIKNSAFCGYLLTVKVKFLVHTIVMFKGRWLLLVLISLWQCQGNICLLLFPHHLVISGKEGKHFSQEVQTWFFSPSVDCIAEQTWSFTPDFCSQLFTQGCDEEKPLSLPLSTLLTQIGAWGLIGYRVGGKHFPKSDFCKWTHVEIYWL